MAYLHLFRLFIGVFGKQLQNGNVSAKMKVAMDDKIRLQIENMENNQTELRASIKKTQQLSDQADKLLAKHKKALKEQSKK